MSETAASAGTMHPTPGKPPSTSRPRRRSGSGGKWFFLLLLIGAGAGGWYWYTNRPKTDQFDFRTATVAKGDIVQEVTANGALSPVKNVEVGTQVSGILQEIKVDFNSKVKQGDLLALIDPSTLEQSLLQTEAELANSQASLELAEVNYRRAKELFKNNLISASEHDTTLAALHQAEASVKIRQANVQRAKVDLARTKITAPIDGVIISRSVDQGQTVAASFNTPKLFVIANDLTKMQIEAAVSEADVGGVEEGQKVSFSVDAFLNRKFQGDVRQVRYAAVTNSSVVSYTTVIDVNNSDLKLRPGMTATAKIVTGQRPGVLRVPNSAFRFRPPTNMVVIKAPASASAGSSTNRAATVAAATVETDSSGVPIAPWRAERRMPTPEERAKFEESLTPEQKEKYQQAREQMRQRFAEGGGGEGGGGRRGGGFGDSPRARPEGPTTATIHVLEKSQGADGKEKTTVKAVTVKAGITDGSYTEVIEGLKEGDVIITGLNTATSAAPVAQSNPFAPNFGPPRGGAGGQRR